MRAATIRGGELTVEDHPDPSPGPGEVLVSVRAAGVNAADLLQLRGRHPAPPGSPPDIPGLEVAGEVAAAGSGVTRVAAGDRVMAIVGGGGQAERCVLHERALMPIPESLGWPQAGGVPEAFATADDALFTQAGLEPGERLLVHGGAGGVGTAAVQLGRGSGARVTATVRDERRRADVDRLGAEAVAPEGFAEYGPFDVVLELVGAPNVEANLRALATGGRIVVIGVGAGARAALDLPALMQRRARIHGSTLRSRPLEEKAAVMRRVERRVLPLLALGAVEAPVSETFPLERVAEAYERFRQRGKLGKLVLTVP